MKYIFLLFLFVTFSNYSQSSAEKGIRLFNQKEYVQAQLYFENMLKQNPNDLVALEYLGDIKGVFKKWDAALLYYEKLKTVKPENANYVYKYGGVLGMIAKESNKFTALRMIGDIKSSFEMAIKLDPKHIDARLALIELYLQLPGIVGGSERKAIHYANELMLLSKVEGYLAKGKIDEYFNRYKLAEKNYLLAIDIGNSKTGYQKLAELYKNKMNQPEKAGHMLALYNEKNKL